MTLTLNNPKVDKPLNKRTKPNQTVNMENYLRKIITDRLKAYNGSQNHTVVNGYTCFVDGLID